MLRVPWFRAFVCAMLTACMLSSSVTIADAQDASGAVGWSGPLTHSAVPDKTTTSVRHYHGQVRPLTHSAAPDKITIFVKHYDSQVKPPTHSAVPDETKRSAVSHETNDLDHFTTIFVVELFLGDIGGVANELYSAGQTQAVQNYVDVLVQVHENLPPCNIIKILPEKPLPAEWKKAELHITNGPLETLVRPIPLVFPAPRQ